MNASFTAQDVVLIIGAIFGGLGGLAAAIVTILNALHASRERGQLQLSIGHLGTGVEQVKADLVKKDTTLGSINDQTNSRLSEALREISDLKQLVNVVLLGTREQGDTAITNNLAKQAALAALAARAAAAKASRETSDGAPLAGPTGPIDVNIVAAAAPLDVKIVDAEDEAVVTTRPDKDAVYHTDTPTK